jgi:uncharacterized protein (DUF427 family)
MQAILNGHVVAEADRDDLIYIERTWYFPPASVKQEYLRKSDTPYTCPWKGECQYFDVVIDDQTSRDSAFSYPQPKPSAIDTVKKDFSNYVAFWRDIQVQE